MTSSIATRVMAGLLGLLAFLPFAAKADGTPAPISSTEGSSRVVAVSAGYLHSCGLKADGSVVCWGYNGNGQISPIPAGPFISVSVGDSHSCGVKADGSVACWGSNSEEQVLPSGGIPAGPYVSVTAGQYHSCGLKADGSVACWGDNGSGAVSPIPVGSYISVSAGDSHTCGVKADGSVACWGSNNEQQVLPLGGIPAGQYVSVTAGGFHSCGLKAAGSVACWGDNDSVVSPIPAGSYLSVSAGYQHTCGSKADGSVACWGYNGFGPVSPVGGIPAGPYVSVSAGVYNSCGLKADGSVQCWGAGAPGSTGLYQLGQSTVPAAMIAAGSAGFGQIAAGNAHACQVLRDGTLSCWGDDSEGQTDAPAGLFTQVVAGDSHSCAIGSDGETTCWGRNGGVNTTRLVSSISRQLAPAPDGAICVLAVPNSTWCYRGAQGNGTSGFGLRNITHDRNGSGGAPSLCGVSGYNGRGSCFSVGFDIADTAYSSAALWQRLESGLNHQCGLKADGSIQCWGDNLTDGQLANMPASSERFRAFSVGWNHACAIRENGTLTCWGSNLNGQAAPPTGTFVQVAAGNTFTCAIRDIGTRVCWGSDAAGQAPQLALSPGLLPSGMAGFGYAGAQFVVGDNAPDADGDYVPPTPAFAVVAGALPAGLTLSATGELSGIPIAGGTFPFTVEAEDANGFAATREYSVTIIADSTAPVITYTLNPAAPNGSNGWYVGNVGITWTVTDAESSITSSTGCATVALASNTVGATYTCTATSAGGSTSVTTTSIKRDATPPTISAAATSAPNANGWYTGNVSVAFTCSDATSGLASCPASQTLSGQGSAVSSTAQTSQDNAGNVSAPSNVVTVKIDRTAPVITAAATTAPNGGGWYTDDVLVHFTCSDALSGLAGACPADQLLTGNGTVASTAQTIYDNAGNAATSNVVTVQINRDITPPTIVAAATTAPNANGWYAADVTVQFTCADNESGLAGPCPANQILTGEGTGIASIAKTIQDNAGNSATSNVVKVKIDKTAPILAPTVPNPLLRDGSYVASPNASDATSGLASSSCGLLDTSSIGTRSVTCNAADIAGNTSSVSLTYTVTTSCVNDGYKGAQLTWCQNICENGLTGRVLDIWIHRWVNRYRDLPYCRVEAD